MAAIRILLVEDDADIAELVKTTLGGAYEFLHGVNGLEGLQLAIEGQPDLVISDVMMPVMNGHQFIERLRKTESFSNLPVIFLSALGSTDQIRKGYNLGAALYLTKPIDPARFRRNVEAFILEKGITPHTTRRALGAVRQAMGFYSGADAKGTHARPEASRGEAPLGPRDTRPPQPSLGPRDTRPPQPAPPPLGPRDTRPPQPHLAPHETRPPSPRPPSASIAPPLKPRVLIADGENDLLDKMRRGLEDVYEVIPARDGIEAIERAAKYAPDLFVIDDQITRMNGFQLIQMLRKNTLFMSAPIIFSTDKADPRERHYIERQGVRFILIKPYDVAGLHSILARATGEPGFAIRAMRTQYRDALIEMSLTEEVGTQAGQARRISQVLRADAQERHKPTGSGEAWHD